MSSKNRCRAKSKRTQLQCGAPAMKNGLCYHHGGAVGSGIKLIMPSQVTHGRYSKCLPADLADRYEYYKTDPDFMNLLNEISVSRALFDKFIGNFQADTPMSAESVEVLGGFLERISRLVEKEHKRRYGEQYTINIDGLNAFVAQAAVIIGEKIDEYVGDTDTASRLKAAIAGGLASIRGRGACVTFSAED